MTGWRIGYAAGIKSLINAMINIQSQSTSNPNSIAQVAAQAALENDQQCVRDMNQTYHQRHELLLTGLQAIPHVECIAADGTFYSFPSLQKFIGEKFKTDLELGEYLLTEALLAIVPGSAFGAPGCIRISYATSNDNLQKALKRLSDALSNI